MKMHWPIKEEIPSFFGERVRAVPECRSEVPSVEGERGGHHTQDRATALYLATSAHQRARKGANCTCSACHALYSNGIFSRSGQSVVSINR